MRILNFLLLIICLLAKPLSTSAQVIQPTTDEEYNYGAVGYKLQLNARLDTKEGYIFERMPKDAGGEQNGKLSTK